MKWSCWAQDDGDSDSQDGRECSRPAGVTEPGRLEAHGDDDGTRDGSRLTRPNLEKYASPMTHDPSSPSKLLVPESRTRNLEAIEHVLFRPGF